MDQHRQQGGGGSPQLVLPPRQQLHWSRPQPGVQCWRSSRTAGMQAWGLRVGGGGWWCGPHLGVLGAGAPSSLWRARRTIGWRGICFGSCAHMCCTGMIAQRTGPAAKAPVLRFQLVPDTSLIGLSMFTWLCHMLLSGSSTFCVFFCLLFNLPHKEDD